MPVCPPRLSQELAAYIAWTLKLRSKYGIRQPIEDDA